MHSEYPQGSASSSVDQRIPSPLRSQVYLGARSFGRAWPGRWGARYTPKSKG
ncbi:hypothetical protein FA13DRAFT_852854 [Coprinellus micaceus]|uniref:Uncharacterized protein n=1 Tax=Coprinellus micaceus TaxID=71717 RepID=A0A4Y7S171_COPMI|nr:hypothetical protein FA13DRAFT_852854 [Coprinellus micaceus]